MTAVVLRDPGGALIALTDSDAHSSADVVWHQLNTREPATAVASYGELFGWVQTAETDLGALGQHRRFAFAAGTPSVGTVSDVEGRPGVHTHRRGEAAPAMTWSGRAVRDFSRR